MTVEITPEGTLTQAIKVEHWTATTTRNDLQEAVKATQRLAELAGERARGHACYGGMSNFQFPSSDVIEEGGMLKNTANTATVRHAGRMFSLLEAAPPTEFDRDLNTLGECDFGGRLQGPMTAHPKVDPVSGDMLFFGYSPVAPYLRYSEVNAAGELVNCTEIEIPAPVMMHDFVVTEHYAIFLDAPAVFDLRQMLDGHDPMSWQPDNGTRLGVIPRGGSGTDVRWFEIDNAQLLSFKETRLPVSEAPRPLVRVPVAFESSAPDEYLAPLAGDDDALVILEEKTIERSWGWVFFYTSRLWQQTGELRYALAGNAPVFVEREQTRMTRAQRFQRTAALRV